MSQRTFRSPIFLAGGFLFAAVILATPSDAERRVLNYIRDHLRPGEPLLVTELYNKVFTAPEERQALDKLYKAFFRIPLFVVQYREKFGAAPSLRVIAQQFDLESPEAAGVLLRVMESDPRIPRFITRDSKTGEITRVNVEDIKSDTRFGRALARQLGGWEGLPAPDFTSPGFDGGEIKSRDLRGKVVLLYVWFTGCPPCMQETPGLVALDREYSARGLALLGANTDRLLGLAYDDMVRRRYADEQMIKFPLVHWTRESDQAYGSISIFPTLFLIDRKGVIIRHWVGFVSRAELRSAIGPALEATPSAP